MSFDVYGLNPKSEDGFMYKCSSWIWHPMWEMIHELYPQIISKTPLVHNNDGLCVDSETSLILAGQLHKSLRSGEIAEYIKKFNDFLENLNDTECVACHGTGVRHDGILKRVDGLRCRICRGTKLMRPIQCGFYMNEENVVEFSKFLLASNGFRVA